MGDLRANKRDKECAGCHNFFANLPNHQRSCPELVQAQRRVALQDLTNLPPHIPNTLEALRQQRRKGTGKPNMRKSHYAANCPLAWVATQHVCDLALCVAFVHVQMDHTLAHIQAIVMLLRDRLSHACQVARQILPLALRSTSRLGQQACGV